VALPKNQFPACLFLTFGEGDQMKMEAIRTIARSLDLHPGNLSKIQLIKAIQSEEGNFDCYAAGYGGVCDQTGCLWREDCFDAAKRGE